MKLATTTGDFFAYTADQIEAITYIYEAGFRYLDYNFGIDYPNRTGAYAEDWQEQIARIKAHAERLGMQFVQAHSPMGRPLAEGNEEFIADTIRCIEVCAMLGIPNLVVHSGYLKNISKEECFAKNKEFFGKLLVEAEKYGINILVENFDKMHRPDYYWVDNAADLLAMVKDVNHPLFHAVWDAGHGNLQETPQDECLRLLGEHVYALHIQDNMGDRDTHMMPFTGTLSIDSLMHGLLDIGYKGYFTFEVGSFYKYGERRAYEADTRLAVPPIALKMAQERLMYQVGKEILMAYDCFEG